MLRNKQQREAERLKQQAEERWQQQEEQMRHAQVTHRAIQGQLTPQATRQRLTVTDGIPLLAVRSNSGQETRFGYDQEKFPGHILIVAPPDRRFLHLRHILWYWRGAGLVLDSDDRLWRDTGAWQVIQNYQTYSIPGSHINLSAYYHLWDERDARRLRGYLMSPLTPEQTLADRSLSLFQAFGHYAHSRSLPVIKVILDAAASPMLEVLTGLNTIANAQSFLRQFTGGLTPAEAVRDEGATRAYTLFTNQVNRFQLEHDTYSNTAGNLLLPADWFLGKGVVFVRYEPETLATLGGMVVATITGVARNHITNGRYKPLLMVMDVAMARLIPDFLTFLQIIRPYGVVVVLTPSTLSEVSTLVPNKDVDTLLAEFRHQIWYAYGDLATAQKMSSLYGTQLRPLCRTCHHPLIPEEGEEKSSLYRLTEPVALPEHILAWPENRPLVITQQEVRYCFSEPGDHSRIGPIGLPPVPMPLSPAPRHLIKWLPEIVSVPPQAPVQANAAAAKPTAASQQGAAAKPERGKNQTSTKPASGNDSEPKVVRGNRGLK